MQVKVECSKCKKEFTVGEGAVEVLQKEIRSCEDEKVVTITYFDCPECNAEHIVQLDDEYTQDLLEQVIALMKAKVLLSRQGKKTANKVKKEFKQKRTLLTEYRNGLMARYNETLFVGVNGPEFILRCTTGVVDEGGDQDAE